MVELLEEGAGQRPPHFPVVANDPDPNNPHPMNRHHNIVSAGESAAGDPDDFSATDDDEEERAYHRWDPSRSGSNDATGGMLDNDPSNNNPPDLLYDENLDQEDEAYVYKHLRGGIQESVTIRTTTSATTSRTVPNLGNGGGLGQQQQQQQQQRQYSHPQTVQMYKPRNSDAVLSCPCCFNIVCMDCQKHKRYANQYRAMFVMGVTVDWNHILVYDDVQRGLVSKAEQGRSGVEESPSEPLPTEHPGSVPPSETPGGSVYRNNPLLRAADGEYYAVECATCGTQVAALDMRDEVYYFHGCLESSSAF